jgi:hypothetical protein
MLYCPGHEPHDSYAELIIRVGANVQPDRRFVRTRRARPTRAPLGRYAAGARVVDVRYADNHVKRR